MPVPMCLEQRAMSMGWYVRVTTDEIYDGVYNTVVYIAGFASPAEAERAVRGVRSNPGRHSRFSRVKSLPGRGPKPAAGLTRSARDRRVKPGDDDTGQAIPPPASALAGWQPLFRTRQGCVCVLRLRAGGA